jgi:hypothetical protein
MDTKPNFDFLTPWNLIRLTSSKPVFNEKQGYVGKVFKDAFEFEEVMNLYEHFSNISDPPILKTHHINFADIKNITL